MAKKNYFSLSILHKLKACPEAQEAFIKKYGENAEVPFHDLLNELKRPRNKVYLTWLMGRYIPFCRYALKNGININTYDKKGNSGLLHALDMKNLSNAKKLIELGADVNSSCDIDSMTPLHLAVIGRNAEIVRFLLLNGANVHARHKDGRTAIFDAFADKEVFDILIKAGAKIDIKTYSGMTFQEYVQNSFDGIVDAIKIIFELQDRGMKLNLQIIRD